MLGAELRQDVARKLAPLAALDHAPGALHELVGEGGLERPAPDRLGERVDEECALIFGELEGAVQELSHFGRHVAMLPRERLVRPSRAS